MRLRPGRLVVLAGLLGLSMPVLAGQVVTAAIPFAFTAGDKEFPAGSYSFEMRSEARQMRVKGRKQNAVVRALDLSFRGDVYEVTKRYEIFFRRYGDDYFLAELWIKQFGMEPLKSAAEVALEEAGTSASVIKLKVKPN